MAAYEQFEASYLFICASIAKDTRARPEIIQEFTANRSEIPEEQASAFGEHPVIQMYRRPRWNVTEFDAKAQRFIEDHIELFADRGYTIRVFPNSLAVGLTGVLFIFGLFVFIMV